MNQKEESVIKIIWPKYNKDALKQDVIQIVVQVNGKLRGKIEIASDATEDQIKEMALSDGNVKKFIGNKPIRKFIYVPGKLANVVV